MKLLSGAIVGIGFVAVLLTAPAWSQTAQRDLLVAQSDQENRERWRKMSEAEKQEMRERFQRWKHMDPREKADLRSKFDNWRKLPSEEKARADDPSITRSSRS